MPSDLQGVAPLTLAGFCGQPPIRLQDDPLLRRQAARESNARSYPRRIPLALRQAGGIYVRDGAGQLYIDCLAGAGTLALGHNHPDVVAALRDTLDSGLPLHTLDLTTPVKDRFVEDLFASLPADFAAKARIQFCGPTGADGIEAALKLTRTATGRRVVLGFSGAYHGMTQGALALMGNRAPKEPLGTMGADVQMLPYPYDYRCPFGLGGEAGVDAGLSLIEQILVDPESGVLPPAAVVVEVVQGEGGVIPAPVRWLQGLRRLTREHGVALVVDEVQTGLGRTGRLYAFEHAGIEPDVLVLSKAIGGGLPLSVVVYNQDLDRWAPGAHAGTFRGNQLAMAAGVETLRRIRADRLDEQAALLGHRLTQHLKALQIDHACLGDVRGLGLMIGVEIVDERRPQLRLGARPADGDLARTIQRRCLEQGLILEVGGRHGAVMRFLPPLIVTADEVDEIAARFQAGLKAALAERPGTVLAAE
ncbi:diaminobutyrate--2-oxoglutarate transaminase [Nitrospirillum viridazoti]|uniref:Diaminobutyrate--2-oxoglutarate transaminase n=1 Tax=Nitrospirillum viridazoti CBAmc TaxID=1441467 RepID=A0A248K1U4_9PROT|nr:diaminobutyrate--2-oxoglutarate transaminase [Nitrospirillum amazonense]ASG24398.1 diaminobutyrate--2-oxoglutarate transaminase [Nitrospirillum amazonense CBAmc]TWB33355.1 diaminobutyrate aminotransferase [Nitrospirillum amazonense]